MTKKKVVAFRRGHPMVTLKLS